MNPFNSAQNAKGKSWYRHNLKFSVPTWYQSQYFDNTIFDISFISKGNLLHS